MDKQASPPERPQSEDLRVFLFLGAPIFLITLLVATLIVVVGPMRGQ